MWDTLRDLVRSLFHATPGALDRATLQTEAAKGILALGAFGEHGAQVFPSGVTVRISVVEGKVDGFRKIVENPSFDRELLANLRNRLVAIEELPARRYVVVAGESEGVEIIGDPKSVVLVLVVEGGDRDGARFPVENLRATWRVGRGPSHDEAGGLPNDFVLTDTLRFVSRAAAVLRYDAGLHVEAREQRAALVVHRAAGGQVRPFNTPHGSCPLAVGDVVELNDGKQAQIRVRCLPGETP